MVFCPEPPPATGAPEADPGAPAKPVAPANDGVGMKKPGPLHGAVWVQTLSRHLLELGYGEREVFGRTEFGPEVLDQEKPVAPFDHIAQFFEHASRLTGDDAIGFVRGSRREMRRIGLLCYVGLSAPTIEDFIRNVARYRRVFSDAVEVGTERLASDGMLSWYFVVPTRVRRRQFVEFGASGLIYTMRQAANRDFCPRLVTFRHARKTNIAVFERFFGCRVEFGAPDNAYFFDKADLALPLMTADNNLYQVLNEFCDRVLSEKSRNQPPILVRVERAIADRLASGEANQETVARALGMSARTLARRLADEETTFFRTLEGLRESLAASYLTESDFSLAEIAYLLGYAGLGSFNDAFKRWKNVTPGQYRAG